MMRSSKWLAARSTALAASLAFLLAGAGTLPPQAQAQEGEDEEECVLQPSAPVSAASEALQAAMDSEDPAEQERRYSRAMSALERPLEDQTDDPAVYFLAGRAQIGLGDYEAAGAYLNRFEELAPECGQEAWNTRYNAWADAFNEAFRMYQAGETDAALSAFERANLIHEDARSLNNAAFLYQQKGETDRAVERWREAMGTGEDPDQVRSAMDNLVATLRAEGRAEDAVEIFEAYLDKHPENAIARVRYAGLLQDVGRIEEGGDILAEILGRDDLTAFEWNQVGIGLFEADSYEEAVEAFTKSREVNPYLKDAMENLVSASIQAGRAGDVNALADTLVAWYPYDANVHQMRAQSLSRTGQGPEAMQALQRGEDTPVAFQALFMDQAGPDTWVVQGTLASRAPGAGQTLTLPFEFIDLEGNVVATEELTVQTAPAGQSTGVELEVTSEEPLAGFRYGEAR